MVRVVDAPTSTFGALAFGTPSHNSLAYMQHTQQVFTGQLTAHAQEFFTAYADAYRGISYHEDMQLIKAAMRATDQYMLPNRIMHLQTIGEFQHAPPIMQGWVMANPLVRQMFFDNALDGYSGSYENHYGSAIGIDHVQYQAAVNGVWRDVDGEMICEIFPLCPHELELRDQIPILSTWLDLDALIKRKGEDPTSRFNAQLE